VIREDFEAALLLAECYESSEAVAAPMVAIPAAAALAGTCPRTPASRLPSW
jgi:hypothetical protein